jgi:hypothetical protein
MWTEPAREAADDRITAAVAEYNRGVALGGLGRGEDAVAAYEQVVSRYGDDPTPALRELVATALCSQGVGLGELGRSEDAVGRLRAGGVALWRRPQSGAA